MMIGLYVHDENVNVVVDKHAICASACTLILIAGDRKLVVGAVAVHALYVERGSLLDVIASIAQTNGVDMITPLVRGYLHDIGADPAFVDFSIQTPTDALHWLDRSGGRVVRGSTGAAVGTGKTAFVVPSVVPRRIQTQERPLQGGLTC
ncbi:MAG TPA: hypothetical protein ENK05_04045 [Gammaproteobacteria bacterium]|nr:hypothetical protein [Gammaproteobacteria bacterium]